MNIGRMLCCDVDRLLHSSDILSVMHSSIAQCLSSVILFLVIYVIKFL